MLWRGRAVGPAPWVIGSDVGGGRPAAREVRTRARPGRSGRSRPRRRPRAATWNRSPTIFGESGTTRSSGPGFVEALSVRRAAAITVARSRGAAHPHPGEAGLQRRGVARRVRACVSIGKPPRWVSAVTVHGLRGQSVSPPPSVFEAGKALALHPAVAATKADAAGGSGRWAKAAGWLAFAGRARFAGVNSGVGERTGDDVRVEHPDTKGAGDCEAGTPPGRNSRAAAAGSALSCVANGRLRHMLIGYARVSKTDGSQSLNLQGDVLVVWKLDRLARNLAHLVNTVQDLSARGVGLRGARRPGRADRHHDRGRTPRVRHLRGAGPTDERRLETEPWRGARHRHRRKPPGTATPSAYRHRASRRLYPPPANNP